jgi:hypothetical protein
MSTATVAALIQREPAKNALEDRGARRERPPADADADADADGMAEGARAG